MPRTGGRQKGTPNKLTSEVRDTIVTKYKPAEFLGRIVLGQKIRTGPPAGPGTPSFAYPSLAQRMEAAQILLGKTLPDLRASEITGKDGSPLLPPRPAIPPEVQAEAIAAMVRERLKL